MESMMDEQKGGDSPGDCRSTETAVSRLWTSEWTFLAVIQWSVEIMIEAARFSDTFRARQGAVEPVKLTQVDDTGAYGALL
jgi:hypothetical protein